MDTRGHGRSTLTSASFHYSLFARDAVAVLDLLEVPAVSVIGWSDGAITGLELAIAKPERIERLFAFGANVSPEGLKPGGSRSPVFASYLARCKLEYARLSPRPERWPELLAGLSAMWRSEPNFSRPQLQSIKAPVTVCAGAYDEIIRRDHTEQIARSIPNARLTMLPAVSHFAMLQDPARFNAALRTFLAA